MKLPDAIFKQHMAVLGKTGSGKSYAAKGFVEQLIGQKRQVCIIDPTDAWWGLRLGSDGRSKGLHVYLIGGKHGDIPLAPQSGAAIARLVTQQRPNVVCDLSDLTVGEYTRWFTDFASTLYTTIVQPMHLVIDEAHYFMPQGKVVSPDAGKMLHAGNRLMSGGRSRGICGLMITQRPAKLHKDSLTCADTLIAMRVIAPQDRNAIKDWVDGAGDPAQGKAVLDSLASLQRGEGWVWYPEGSVLTRTKFPKIKTYDSSATPEHRAKRGPEVSQINLDEVREAMASAVEEAKANDPRELRKQVAELKAQLAKTQPITPAKAEIKTIEKPVVTDAQMARVDKAIERIAAAFADANSKIGDAFARFSNVTENGILSPIRELRDRLKAIKAAPGPGLPVRPATVPARALKESFVRPGTAKERQPKPSSGDGADLPLGERKILSACIQYPDGLGRSQITTLTGLKKSTRNRYIQYLQQKGLVAADGDTVRATEEGIAAIPDCEPLPTGEALQRYWIDRLPAGERAILEVLIEAYPNAVDRDTLSERTGLQKSTRNRYLQYMAAKELVEGRGDVRATVTLFSQGRES